MATVAAAPSLQSLLTTLTTSLESAATVLPAESTATSPHPTDGLSLLDTKNDLLLSYVQHLVFLLLLKLRGLRRVRGDQDTITRDSSQAVEEDDGLEDGEGEDDGQTMQVSVVKRLVELRLYMDKGVKPLEKRLQYQLDKVVRAAEDAERVTMQKGKSKQQQPARKSKKEPRHGEELDSASDSGAESDYARGTEEEDEDEDEDAVVNEAETRNETYGPNIAAFRRPQSSTAPASSHKSKATSANAVYRPPRITPMAPPQLRSSNDDQRRQQRRAPHKSATLDEFVTTELSAAPAAEPSIGSTIVRGGRGVRSARERAEEAERREYEEANFTRLPREGKKEMARKRAARGEGDGVAGWGGEEWRDLGSGLDRIERLTKRERGKGGGGGGGDLLERSRKRKAEGGDGGGGGGGAGGAGGMEMGEMWQRKKRHHMRRR